MRAPDSLVGELLSPGGVWLDELSLHTEAEKNRKEKAKES